MDEFSCLPQLDLAQLIRSTKGYTIMVGEGTFDLSKFISAELAPPLRPLPNMFESAWHNSVHVHGEPGREETTAGVL